MRGSGGKRAAICSPIHAFPQLFYPKSVHVQSDDTNCNVRYASCGQSSHSTRSPYPQLQPYHVSGKQKKSKKILCSYDHVR